MILKLILFSLVLHVAAASAVPEKAATTSFGDCSPVSVGNQGVVNVTCTGLDKETANRLVQIVHQLAELNRRAGANQDARVVSKKLDEIMSQLSDLNSNIGDRKVASLDVSKLAAYNSTRVIIQYDLADPETKRFASELRAQLLEAGWTSVDDILSRVHGDMESNPSYFRGGINVRAVNTHLAGVELARQLRSQGLSVSEENVESRYIAGNKPSTQVINVFVFSKR